MIIMIIMKQINICKKCGYEWKSKVINPKSCPSCKQYKWKVENKDELK